MPNYDDKDLVIISVLLIMVAALAIPYVQDPAFDLVEKALYGLFGIAVGKAVKGDKQ